MYKLALIGCAALAGAALATGASGQAKPVKWGQIDDALTTDYNLVAIRLDNRPVTAGESAFAKVMGHASDCLKDLKAKYKPTDGQGVKEAVIEQGTLYRVCIRQKIAASLFPEVKELRIELVDVTTNKAMPTKP